MATGNLKGAVNTDFQSKKGGVRMAVNMLLILTVVFGFGLFGHWALEQSEKK